MNNFSFLLLLFLLATLLITCIPVSADLSNIWYNKGVVLSLNGGFEEAIDAYNKAIEINPDYDAAWYARGYALRRLEIYSEALKSYNRALEINPKNADALFGRAYLLQISGDSEGAVKEYTIILDRDPDNAAAWNNLGRLYFELERTDESIHAFTQALAITHDYDLARSNLDIVTIGMDQHTPLDSGAYAPEAIEWFKTGHSLINQHKYYDANEAFDKAIKIEPYFIDAWNGKGISLLYQGKYSDALGAFERTLAIDPENEFAKTFQESTQKRYHAYLDAVKISDPPSACLTREPIVAEMRMFFLAEELCPVTQL